MKMYLLSFGAGLLVGVVYSVLNVRSPAPPLVALLGLLGILAGEQLLPLARHLVSGNSLHGAWHREGCQQHLFGSLPGRKTAAENGGEKPS